MDHNIPPSIPNIRSDLTQLSGDNLVSGPPTTTMTKETATQTHRTMTTRAMTRAKTPPDEPPQEDEFSPSVFRAPLASARHTGTYRYNYQKGAVVWETFFKTFRVPERFHRTFQQGVRLFPNAPPPAILGEVDRKIAQEIVTALLDGGVVIPARRSPYVSTVFLVPKSIDESRLIVDFSRLTPHLPCPRFYLPSVFQLLGFLDFESKFLCKLDLKDAFFHINIHPESQYVTTFKFDNKYYKYTCLRQL